MRTSLSIPDEVLTEFDHVWQEQGIENRSRAIREAMQEYIEAHSRLESASGEVVALVAFDYRHHEVIEQLHSIQHDYQDVILNTSHIHQEGWCLESLFCRGNVDLIRALTYELRDFDGVNRVKIMTLQQTNDYL